MVADYHSDTPHVLDFKKYPGKVLVCKFFAAQITDTPNYWNHSELLTHQIGYDKPGLEERQRFIRIYLSSEG